MSFLFGKKKETEREEYERLLKEAEDRKEQIRTGTERYKKLKEEYERPWRREREARIKYLEEKFNPKKDKISIIIPDNYEITKNKVDKVRKNEFEEIVKKYPNISFEEAILRSFGATGIYYKDDYFIKKFKELSNTNLTNSSPPKPPPLPLPPKRFSPKKSKSKLTKEGLELAKSKLKPKSPPKPPPLPLPPKRSSPKRSSPKRSKSKLTKEELEIAKSKLKHSQKKLNPDNPDYDLEMAFRNLEK